MHFDFGRLLGRGVVLQSVTPEEPLLQRVRFVMYADLPPLFANFFLWSEATHVRDPLARRDHLQFERDLFIWSNKRYVAKPLLCRKDGPIGKHRRWYSQFYSPPGTCPPTSRLDW